MKPEEYNSLWSETFPNTMLFRVSIKMYFEEGQNSVKMVKELIPFLNSLNFIEMKEKIPGIPLDLIIELVISKISKKRKKREPRYIFVNKSEKQYFKLSENLVEIALYENSYKNYIEFKKIVLDFLNNIHKLCNLSEYSCISIKYINKYSFSHNKPEKIIEDYQKYFEYYLNPNIQTLENIESHFIDIREKKEKYKSIIKLVLNNKREKENQQFYYFIDIENQVEDSININNFNQYLDELHVQEKKKFFSLIKKPFVIEVLKNKEIPK